MRTAKTSGLVRAGAMMAVATVVSRATGFLAKLALVAVIGFSLVNDAYIMANTLPNIVFELLLGGVLTSVAIPLLSRARSDPDGGQGYTNRLVTTDAVGLVAATGLAMLAAPLLTRLYLSGNQSGQEQHLATQFAYLLLPQIFFYGIAALFGAILNTKERFAAPAWAPVANNLIVIGVAVLLAVSTGGHLSALTSLSRAQLLLLGIGTTAGIAVQALVLLPSLHRSGYRFRWRWGGDPRMREAGALMIWAVVYVVISQIGYVVTTRIASGTDEGFLGLYNYASMLFQLPYGILGVSLLTAIMPRMSRHAADGRMDNVKTDMWVANRLSAVTLLPVSAAMIALAVPLAVVTARYGAVTAEDTAILAHTLAAFAIGLLPLAVTLVQMRVFYAMKDARTPTLINLIMVRGPSADPAGLHSAADAVGGARSGCRHVRVLSDRGRRRRGLAACPVRPDGLGPNRRHRSQDGRRLGGRRRRGLVRGGPGAALRADEHTGGGAVGLLAGGIVGLVVVGVVALLLRVEELDPVLRRLRRRPAAPADDERTTVHGTLVGAAGTTTPSRASGTMATVGPTVSTPVGTIRGQVTVTQQPGDPANLGPTPPPGTAQGAPRQSVPTPQSAPTPSFSALVTRRRAGGHRPIDDEAGHPAGPGPVAPVTLAPGAVIGGRYRLVALIASDSAGNRFWRARDTVLPRDMAVTLLPDGPGTSATVARTLRAGRLHHIGLPQTLDVGTEGGPGLRRRPVGRRRDPDRPALRRPAGAGCGVLHHREDLRSGGRGAPQRHRPRCRESLPGAGELRRPGPALARHRACQRHHGRRHQRGRRVAVPDVDRHLAAGSR